ncbi:hypothetical protein D4T62_10615 [Salmonella enterica subsp. enterica]|nr:hypothetical protein [Salmonella enterica subsp. enterica]EDR3673591.1 hypothetical protein [Salmonella enterica subsp. arizonae serovar 40:z4,z24:]
MTITKGYDDGSVVHFPGMVTRAGGEYNDGMLMDETGTPGRVCAVTTRSTGEDAQGRTSKNLTANSDIAGVIVGDSRAYIRDYPQYGAIPVLSNGYICVIAVTDVTAGAHVGYDANGNVGAVDYDAEAGTGTYYPINDLTKFETDAHAGEQVVIRILV